MTVSIFVILQLRKKYLLRTIMVKLYRLTFENPKHTYRFMVKHDIM